MLQETHESKDRSGNPWSVIPKPPGREDLGGGYTIQHFKDLKITTYITNLNEKTKIVMNSEITLV